MSNQVELKAKVSREMFYNSNSSFGVYAFEPVSNRDQIKYINQDYDNFVVSGSTFQLFEGNEYTIIIEETENAKYGKGYGFVAVKQDKPTSVDEQHAYIRAMLKEKQAEALIEAYPKDKILDLMKEDKINLSKVKGVGEKKYEKIKHFLLSNLDIQEAISELKDLGITFKAMKKLIDYFGSAELVVQKVKMNIYNLCLVPQFGFKTVDKYALNRGDDKESPYRIKAGLRHLLQEEESKGHSWVSVFGLIELARELLQIDSSDIEDVINDIQNSDSKEFYFGEDRIANYKTYYTELAIKRKLFRLLEAKSNIKVANVEDKIKSIEEKQGFAYTEEQKEAIQMAIQNNVMVLNGKGGVGKTATVKGIIGAMNNYLYMTCALSGKASNVLSNNGLLSGTIHRTLGYDPQGGFIHNSQKPLPYHIVVLDETSMVNIQLFHSLIDAIKEGSKFIIVGDMGQLTGIGVGAVFRDLIKSGKIPSIELTKVQRQAQKSGILSSANTIRDGKQILGRYDYGKHVFGELNDFHVFNQQDKETIKTLVIDICKKYKGKDIDNFQVITALKERGDLSVLKLNKELQEIFNDTNQISIKRGSYEYYKGDKIIQCGNNYEAGDSGEVSVFNGTIGRIVQLEEGDTKQKIKSRIWIKFEGIDEIVSYSQDEMDQIELAYAISCHRSQGSTIKNVLFVFDYSAYMLLSRQFVYTGITRASKACIMLCESNALQHAIRTDHSDIRRTFLYDMLVSD